MKKIMLHQDLDVWQVSMEFVSDIYKATECFPNSERFGLVQQISRAAVSIPSNIAEGSARKNLREFIQFLYYSLGSSAELETQLELSRNLGYLKNSMDLNVKLKRIGSMIINLIKALKKNCQ